MDRNLVLGGHFEFMQINHFCLFGLSIFLICCSGWVWESVPTHKVSVAILSRSNHRLTGLLEKAYDKVPREECGIA